ncbi:MAG: site-2 protease family protein [Nanoarchaeota archaeon]
MSSVYIYDISFLIIFSLFVIWFLYKRRSNLKREGIMYLYRTKVGIKFIDYIGAKYKKFLSVYAFIGVIVGYFLMFSMVWFLYKLLSIYLFNPDIVRAIKIPPLMPLIPYLPEAFNISFLPPFYFTYWIISIAVIALFHEFAHGIIARRYNIKILTTGFGFLGPFLAAFVEPDEKDMENKSKYHQLAVLSAGVFTNLLLSILFFLLLSIFFLAAYAPAGAVFNSYTPGIVKISDISMIGGKDISDNSVNSILNVIESNGLRDELILGSEDNQIKLTEIKAGNKKYYITLDNFITQLKNKNNEGNVILFEDLPALKAGLRGAIIKINSYEIREGVDLSLTLKNFKVGDNVKIITRDQEEILNYNINLAADSKNPERAVIGIALIDRDNGRVFGKVTEFFNFFKKTDTDYQPKYNPDLILFIYNLIWWLALINLSVALMNMWPVAIFDGGRFFMITIWGLTGNKKFAENVFRFVTYLILGSLALLMIGWFLAVF